MDLGKYLPFSFGPSDLNLGPEEGLSSAILGPSPGLGASGGPPMFRCPVCSRSFSALAAYETHLQTQHVTTQCPLCLVLLDQTHFSKHLYNHHRHNLDPQFLQSQNLTQCPTCLKVLNASYFMKHFKGFHEAHICAHCSAVLAGEKAWEKHFKDQHQGLDILPGSVVGSFFCCHCDFSCSLEIEYQQHLSVCRQPADSHDFEVTGEEEVLCEMAVDPNQNVIELGQITHTQDPETREIRPIFVPVEASVWNSQAEKLCAEMNPSKKSRKTKNSREVRLPDGSKGFDLSQSKRDQCLEAQAVANVEAATKPAVKCRKVHFN
ncbi:uncharacterized protein LOC131884182 isoform X2 [Tigriopus californicus]|nr:uncharacterized protein LOC131884182 isoform X2 [Tigriopus californicus]